MKFLVKENANGYEEIPVDDDYVSESGYFLNFGENSYVKCLRKNVVLISGESGDVVIPGMAQKIVVDFNHVLIEGDFERLYLNRKKPTVKDFELNVGDEMLIRGVKIIFGEGHLKIFGENAVVNLRHLSDDEEKNEDFPSYRRSPRLIKKIDDKKIKIESEPSKDSGEKRTLMQLLISPLVMLSVTILVSLVLKRGIFIIMSAGFTIASAVVSIVRFFQDKKDRKIKNEEREKNYSEYLLRKRKELYEQYKSEQEANRFNFPTMQELAECAKKYDSRIYEKTTLDEDFLTFTIGHYIGRPAFSIDSGSKEVVLEKGKFTDEIKTICSQYASIDKPEIVDLKNANVGLVGEARVIHEQLKYIVSQLALFHSYHDLQFVCLFSKEDEEHFKWMRWLPHTKLSGINVTALVSGDRMRDIVLGSLLQVIKDRSTRIAENQKQATFLPHYIFIIDEPRIIMDHSIMEFLNTNNPKELGFSVIYTSSKRANLPENIGTVIEYYNSVEGSLVMNEKVLMERHIDLYDVKDVDFESYARDLSVLVHEQNMTSHIPESITFFEMYGVKSPEELNIKNRWRINNSSKTLGVPLGARAKDDYLELNLHEKAHGPHGLIAGTTGSGKSEIVQSYILSLAVNFHPHEVGFLLIDYKGGGMANLFKNLPHLLGTITNLDGSESLRALTSIQSELRRRQKIFSMYDVNHINAYNDLYKEGKAKEPIPHLFIISDEFAELKKEQPEFMKELVSTARIGRSLGVHLILATQKPSGIVDDQIWTNSKFKLCLKVQNESDSREVLHTSDAANIVQPGRAYLQVGNNEIYELFQSAWSGAMYVKETEEKVTQDLRVYVLNELGQGMLVNMDLRDALGELKAKETELDVITNYIQKLYEEEHAVEVMKPWLPSLESKIVFKGDNRRRDKADLTVHFGVVDVPEEQSQSDYSIDLEKQGNVVYMASPGFGKTVFLANAMIQLAAKNQVSKLNMYVLDFGNNALISLGNIPHVADYIMLDDVEKFEKFRNILTEEIRVRKKLFATHMVQNFFVYNETAEEPMKAIVVLIDNFDAIKEMGFEMEDYFTRITRDGSGLGIYTLVTLNRTGAMRMATMNNFKNKIGGFNFDEMEVKSIVGRSKYSLPEIKGRALVKMGENVNVMQLYTPVDFEDEVDYNKNIKDMVQMLRDANPGEEAEHIPMLPEDLYDEDLMEYKGEDCKISIGLDKEKVVRLGIGFNELPFLILGETGSGKTNALQLIINQILGTVKLYVIDSRSRKLNSYRKDCNYVSTKEDLEDLANDLLDIVDERKRYRDTVSEGMEVGPEPEPIVIVIDDIDDMVDFCENDAAIITSRFKKAANEGVMFIVTGNVVGFKSQDDFTRYIKTLRNGLLLSQQGYFSIFPIKPSIELKKPDGCLMRSGEISFVRLPKVNEDAKGE